MPEDEKPVEQEPTDEEKERITTLFPGLKDGEWKKTGDATGRPEGPEADPDTYNCISWSLCRDDIGWTWWQVDSVGDNDGEVSVEDFDAFYQQQGFTRCGNSSTECQPECKKRKVALFCSNGEPTHAAKEREDGGWWESKLGGDIKIKHKLDQLEGGFYGNVCACYCKSDENANLDLCPKEISNEEAELLESGDFDSIDQALEDIFTDGSLTTPKEQPLASTPRPPKIYGEEIDFEIKRPIVVVPGIMGSMLWKKPRLLPKPTKIRWPPLLPGHIKDLATATDIVPSGLVPFTYDKLLKFLRAIGYKDGETLFVFAYDWRQSNEKTGGLLKETIDTIVDNGPWDSVDVINHSMGGIVTRKAHLLGAPIVRSVYIASPHYGSPNAYLAIHPDLTGHYFDNFIGNLLPIDILNKLIRLLGSLWTNKMKTAISGFDSIYELLPDEFYLNQVPLVNSITGVGDTYYPSQPNPKPWKLPAALTTKVTKAMSFKTSLGASLPGRINLVIYSNSVATEDHVSWDEFRPVTVDGRRLTHPTVEESPGDGTVPVASSTMHNSAPNLRQVSGGHVPLPNLRATHIEILKFFNATS